MKDYRLSEIVAHCIEHQTLCDGVVYYDCENCEHNELCHITKWGSLIGNKIEPRDMIELSCKIATPNDIFIDWQVIWRTKEGGCIGTKSFDCEAKADAFLAELKGDKECKQ